MKLSPALLFCFGCFIATSLAHASGKVYKWVDDKGAVHFSEHPPLNTETEVIKKRSPDNIPIDYGVPSATASSSSLAAKTTAAKSSSPSTQNTQAPIKKDQERCDNARKNQDILGRSGRIRAQDTNGEYRYLTPEEIQQRITETNTAIEESCE